MTRPFRLLTTLALLSALSPVLSGCGGGEPGIDEEIDTGGYPTTGTEAAPSEDIPAPEDALTPETPDIAPDPAPIEAAEPTP